MAKTKKLIAPKIAVVSAKGQVVLPKEARQDMGIKKGSILAVTKIDSRGLLLTKVSPGPTAEELRTAESVAKAWKDVEKGRYKIMSLEQHGRWLERVAKRSRKGR